MTSQNNIFSNIKKLFGITVQISPDALPVGLEQEIHPANSSGKKHWR